MSLLLRIVVVVLVAVVGSAPAQTGVGRKGNGMKLVWAEQGIGDTGTPPNPDLWGLRVTDQWQNSSELQAYTQSLTNAYYDGSGHLIIKAVKETVAGKGYSSAKLDIRHSAQPKLWLYGLFEARIKVPTGTGAFPAFWLLGEDNLYGWPYCGEIDVMEAPASSSTAGQLHQGTHSPGASNGSDVTVGVPYSVGSWGADYHTYSINWQPGEIEFFIDHKSTGKVTRAQVEAAGGAWVFDHRPQSPILNLAVGGWAGTPDPAWTTQTMTIDWVRIYQ
jgi:beta-glucanase (GH16 family)